MASNAQRAAVLLQVSALLLLWPAIAHAQTSASPVPAKSRSTVIIAGNGDRCASLTSSPTVLMMAPEGRALLRFKRELENVAEMMGQTADSTRRIEIGPMMDARRGVDSLMQIVVRIARSGAHDDSAFTVRRGDSVRVMVREHGFDPRVFFEKVDAEHRASSPLFETEIRDMGPRIQATIRSLQPQVAALSEAARLHATNRPLPPTGWLGLHMSESKITIVTAEGAMTNYCEYPVVESVDAGSPADRGGLTAGDTVLAFNGRDVRQQAVNYSELLVPGRQLQMRIQRAARTRDVVLTVGARPRPVATAPDVPQPSGGTSMMTAPPPSPSGMVFTFAPMFAERTNGVGGAMLLAGAQLSVVDDELAQSLGIEPGVLVLRVLPGTPAADGGLHAGDVIRALNGVPVRELAPLRRAFILGASREVKLSVSGRNQPMRVVTVRW